MYSNGKIYVGTDQQGNPIGISIYDVQQALGVGSQDLYTLYRSVKVNKWSKYKAIPMFGFWLTFEGLNYEAPINPAAHDSKSGMTETWVAWWYGNLWAWKTYNLFRKVVTVSGVTMPLYNVAGMWIPTFEDITLDNDYNYDATTLGKIRTLLEAIEANPASYNWKAFLWSEVEALQAYSSLTFVERITDFKNYDHKSNEPINYTYPLSLTNGQTVTFGISGKANELPISGLLSAAADLESIPNLSEHRYDSMRLYLNIIVVNGSTTKMFGSIHRRENSPTHGTGDNSNVFTDTYGQNVAEASVDVSVNDMGANGDTVKIYFIASLASYQYNFPDGYHVRKNLFLPFGNYMPVTRTIGVAGSILRQLIAAGGNRWDFTLKNNGVISTYGDSSISPQHNATFTVRLVNPTSAAVTVDLTQLQARWTWTGYYYKGWPNASDTKQRTPHDAWRITLNYYVNGTQIATPTAYQMAAGADITLECRLMQVWSSPLDDPYTVQNPTSVLFLDEYMLDVQNARLDAHGDGWVLPEDFSTKYGSSPAEALDNILSIDVVHTENNETVKEHLATYEPRFTLHYTDDNPPA